MAHNVTEHIEHAFALAQQAGEQALGTTSPNPPVGAVVLGADGSVLGTGYTQPPGGAHAELQALREAGDQARGATLVVTLEPCKHQGRTGPCTEAILEAGIAEVFFAQADPGAREGGGGQWLLDRGVTTHHLKREVAALRPWLEAQRLQRPYVVAKIAQTLDGYVAAADGTSQWITGPAARAAGHQVRAQVDAIMVGTGTVLADDPALTARVNGTDECFDRQPRKVVIGTRGIPAAAKVYQAGAQQYPSPEQALDALWHQGDRFVLVEGGPGLISSMLRADLVDELHVYTATKLLGAGRGSVDKLAHTLDEAVEFALQSVQTLGGDVAMKMLKKRG